MRDGKRKTRRSRAGNVPGLIVLILLVSLATTSCSNEAIKIGEKKELKTIEITPINVIVSQNAIYPPKGTSGYSVRSKGMSEVAFIASIKNVSDKTIDLNSEMNCMLEQGGAQHVDWFAYVLADDGAALAKEKLEPGGEKTVYFLIDVASDTRGKATVTLGINGSNKVVFECDTSKPIAVAKPVRKNELIAADRYGSFQIKSAKKKNLIKPQKPSADGNYIFWKPKGGDEALDIVIQMKSFKDQPFAADRLSGAMVFAEDEMRAAECRVEKSNGSDFMSATMIDPNKDYPVHFIVSLPKNINLDAVYIYFDGQYYHYPVSM